MSATVLFVDDEQNVLQGMQNALRRSEYVVRTAIGPQQALDLLRHEQVDVVISDQLMPGMSGLEFLGLVHDRQPDAIRIMMTGHIDAETAIRAINEGEIYRFLTKPCDRTELLVTLHLACDKLALERENRRLLALVRTHPELLARLEQEDLLRHGTPAASASDSHQPAR
jgi:two-component system, probable response regulator PhcQ